jgi:hypothetical protein
MPLSAFMRRKQARYPGWSSDVSRGNCRPHCEIDIPLIEAVFVSERTGDSWNWPPRVKYLTRDEFLARGTVLIGEPEGDLLR